jgi:hypothetical protein
VPTEPIGLNSSLGGEAIRFGANHDLTPVGGTFSWGENPGSQGGANAAANGPQKECPFAITFGRNGASKRGTDQRNINLPAIPEGADSPALYQQFGTDDWRPLPGAFQNGVLSVTPTEFGTFQVFAKLTNPKPSILETYVFPNPAKQGQTPTLHISVKMAANISIRIYDVSGDLVLEKRVTSALTAVDGVPCYEEPLDPKKFKSGVYIYTITADRSDKTNEKVREKGKFTVVN